MRVVVVHNRYRSANPSGENQVVEADIEQLRAQGLEVIPYIRDSDEIDGFTPVGKSLLGVRPLVSPVDALAFRRLLKHRRPDVVHLHNPFPLISPWIVRTAKAQRIPVVQTVHNYRHVCVNGVHFRDGAACFDCVGKKVPWPAVVHGCYQGSKARSVPMAAAVMAHRGTWDLVDRFLPVGEAVADHLRALGIPDERIEVRPPGAPASEIYESVSGRPFGTVVLVGPDGAGKTTLANELRRRVEGSGGIVHVAHFRPRIVGGGAIGDGAPVPDPQAVSARPLVVALARTLVVWFDFVLGWKGRWRRDARRGLVVMERPWLDQAVDPARYRLPSRVVPAVRILGRALPRADVAVALSGDAVEVHRRKPEIGAAEVSRQLEEWRRRLPEVARRSMSVDTVHRAPGAVADDVERALRTVPSERAGSPVWRTLPLHPARLGMIVTSDPVPVAASGIYLPQRRRSQLAARVGVTFARLGVSRGTSHVPEAVSEVIDQIDLAPDAMAVMNSSTSGRWVIGIERHGRLTEVVKVGALGDAPLANEIEMLLHLRAARCEWAVPEVLAHGTTEAHRYLVTRAVVRDRRARTVSVDDIVPIVNDLVTGPLSRPIVHHDLAPWNVIRDVDGQLVVLDWEAATFEHRPMFDLLQFVVSTGELLGRPSPEAAIASLTHPGRAGCRHVDAVAPDHEVRQLLRSSLENGDSDAGDRFLDALRARMA